MSSTWPTSALGAAERAYDLLTCEPSPLTVDCRSMAGLPRGPVPLPHLRRLLLSPATDLRTRDLVWEQLVLRARDDGPAWVIATVGMAMPGLRRLLGMLTGSWRGDAEDLEADLVTGFVERLRTLDLQAPRICGRLIDAGARAARRGRDFTSDTKLIRSQSAGPQAPPQPWDHPDMVLGRAVVTAVIDVDEARLIGSTRLEHESLEQTAAAMGISADLAAAWRHRAERRLAAAIRAGELDFVFPRSRRRPTAVVVG